MGEVEILQMDFTDTAFIVSLKNREEDAWNLLYSTVAPKLNAFIIHRLWSLKSQLDIKEKALDLVADTFERAISKINTFNPSSSNIRTWLYNIAQNLVTDYWRKLYSEIKKIQALAKPAVIEKNTQETIEQILENLNLSTIKLSDLEKKYIELMYIEKLSDKIISEMMGVKLSTVRVARKRLLDKLRNTLQTERGKLVM